MQIILDFKDNYLDSLHNKVCFSLLPSKIIFWEAIVCAII